MNTEIIAQKREILGKAVSQLRETGVIPAELYGHNVKNIHLGLPKKEFSDVFKVAGENEIINLVVDDKKIPVLVHDIQKNALTDEIIHVDFYQVKMTEKIIVATPLDFVGEAPAIKEKDGVLVKAMHEIKVEALPANLPHSIKVDLSSLDDIGKNIHVGDLSIPKDVKVLVDPQTVVATITEKAKEEEVVVEEPKVDEIVTEAEAKRAQAEKEKTEEGADEPAKPVK
ncbi:MAG: 50S ribosomal protein L25 [Candidatus Paceibacterota bacterium]|jgi:large subunit ribosomal protein L25